MQAAIAACCLFASPHSGIAQESSDTFNRLNRLEREIETLNRAVYRGETPPAGAASSGSGDPSYQSTLEVRLSDLEKQLRDLTGKIEQQGFEIQQLRERVERAQADTDLRLGDLEKRSGIQGVAPAAGSGMTAPLDTTLSGSLAPDETTLPPVMSQPTSTTGLARGMNDPAPADSPTQGQLGVLREAPGGATIPPDRATDPAALYENAFSQLKGGNVAVAQRDFDGFLKSFPGHPLAANATYWLGETYYAQSKFDQASRIFAESYKKYPKGPKAADSLLKLGMSLGGTGKTKEACLSLKQLKKEFSSTPGTAVRRADQEISRLGCAI